MDGLRIEKTPIPGLYLIGLAVHGDNRGWFKENWRKDTMTAAGLPAFDPVQNNISYNEHAGTTRGIHAEPWNKLVSVAHGRVFGAWVDLREGDSFGTQFSTQMGPETAIFVPRGVGNGYQTLEKHTTYSYLVDEHWSAEAHYTFLNVADETAAVPWPIKLNRAELSDKDRLHPRLAQVIPVSPRKTLVLGGDGQLGRALAKTLPHAEVLRRSEFDLSDPASFDLIDWTNIKTVVNAAAYTNVDEAETFAGRREAWRTNVHGLIHLARRARRHDITVIQVSSDYVFDGRNDAHDEEETFSPLGVYGQTKAAGDAVIMTLPKHYIVRTSWVIGDGANFIKTMKAFAHAGVSPEVVNDQIGKLTYADGLAEAIVCLIKSQAPYGTYNVTGDSEPMTWHQIAAGIFTENGRDASDVRPVTTSQYGQDKNLAPRPANSVLSTDKWLNLPRTSR